jgi:catechol 2,3-dioxygenase-like lactoylglutathione lyase family enzyme
LFLGIDHTAIVVRDTEQSLRFYRDALGMTVAGGAENWGTEQEHLNNVFGARLRITTLRAQSGPGVELLEYLAPSDGRDAPRDTKSNDLWHWQVLMGAPEVNRVELALRTVCARLVSPGVVAMASLDGEGALPAIAARDPDGHAVVVWQRAR